jgi:hypothetical protein
MIAMRHFAARTEIAAPAARVWDTLLDVAAWPSWDPGLERVEGTLDEGGRVTIHVTESSRPFRLRVTEREPGSSLVLRGGLPLGLFSGTRRYRLEALAPDRTSFSMEESYAGLLAPAITRSIPDLQPSFDAFTSGLRRAAETRSQDRPLDPERGTA